MSREDWVHFDEYRKWYQGLRVDRRADFVKVYDKLGFTAHHDTHYSIDLLGDRLDYWPGKSKWRWRNKTSGGDVISFIDAQRKKARKYHAAYMGANKQGD